MSRSRTKGWKDPRNYGASDDPLELALSILNDTPERLEDADPEHNPELSWFWEQSATMKANLDSIARGGRPWIHWTRWELPLRGLAVQFRDGAWRYSVKSRTRNTRTDRHWLTIAAVWFLLELPENRERKARLSRCSYCGRFFFHSQRRKRLTPCSDPCKTGKFLSKRDREKRAQYERELRERHRKLRGAVSVSRQFPPKKVTISL